jgi:hypothetical protein
MKRIVLSPDVDSSSVQEYARALRASQRRFAMLSLLDLDGRRVRKPQLKAAQEAKVRIVDIDSRIPADVLHGTACNVFGEPRLMYREVDEEEIDIYLPDAAWLQRTFGNADLGWLLESEEEPIPWNKQSFYVFPNNPDEWGVTVPLCAGLLAVARPGESRVCPMCGTEFTSKRQDMCQCPSSDCNFVSRPFASVNEARCIAEVPLSAFAWGTCPRCRLGLDFVNQIEQCSRCGQLLRGFSDRHSLELKDNAEEITKLLSELFSTAGRKGTPWWKLW